ncbi:MAG: ISNCY family transposase [Chloroflexi bacterium]|nr:ISNCY family transposase [Chloroflexota bacterium]
MDARAQHRLYVLNHVLTGGLTAEEAARVLHLSIRQVRRLLRRYRADGSAGLVHGNRARSPGHRIAEPVRARVIELATTTYAGVNHTHLAELLAEREGIAVAERTLRRILAEASVRPVRTRRPPRHRSRRERMAREGQLLQVDGSRHRWFGPDRPFATLVAGIDDATGRVPGGTFRAQEDAVGYFTTFAQTTDRHGLPGAVYSDRHGIFIVEQNRAPTLAEQLTGKRSLTQVGRALDAAGVAWIGAHSPQAKGRVERLWGTLQDRLTAELRLAGITTIEAANAFLPDFLERHNARFAVPAADPEPAWRPWPEGQSAEAVFCFHYRRRVDRDSTVSWPGGDLALPRRSDGRSWAGRSVVVQERLDGSLWVSHGELCVPLGPAPVDPGQLRARRLSRPTEDRPELDLPSPPRSTTPDPRPGWTPGPDHPWRGRYAGRGR